MKIIEQFVQGKTGHAPDCEDRIVVTDHLAAIIDGSTSKTDRRYDGLKPGQKAAELLAASLALLPPGLAADDATEFLTGQIADYYQAHGLTDHLRAHPVERICGSLVLYHRHRRQVWCIGDSFYRFGEQVYQPRDRAEEVGIQARALYLELQVLAGRPMDELRRDDPGRAFIMPLLTQVYALNNNLAAGEYACAVLDGFPVPPSLVQVVEVPPSCREVVLASDGYPALLGTLAETEAYLHEVLAEDPLCFRRFKATKGVLPGNLSFDDRAYLRLDVSA
jgi:hypothetical protein